MQLRLLGLGLLMLLAAGVRAAGDDTPMWLQQAAKVSVPGYEKDLPAVVLQREQHVTVSEDGRITAVTMFAVRILIREGRGYADVGKSATVNCQRQDRTGKKFEPWEVLSKASAISRSTSASAAAVA